MCKRWCPRGLWVRAPAVPILTHSLDFLNDVVEAEESHSFSIKTTQFLGFCMTSRPWCCTMELNSLWTRIWIPYARHYNLLLIWNRSWILTVLKVRILWKKLLKLSFLSFKNGVKNPEGYNGNYNQNGVSTPLSPAACIF